MADYLNHFINVEERHQQTFKDVQALEDFFQTVVQAVTHGITTEGQPLRQDFKQVFHRRTIVQADHVEVDAVAFFQIGGGEQVVHHLLHIHAVGTRHDHQTGRVFMIRFITQIINHRQLFVTHLRGDLFQHARAGHLMRQRANHHRAVFFRPHGAHAHRTAAVLVDFANFRARGNDFRFGRVVRPLHDIQQLIERGFRFFQQRNRRLRHFTQVVRRNIGSHTDRNAGGAVQQDVRQTRRQHFWLLQRTVKVRHPIDGALTQFAEQQFGVFRQAGFGVTHRREGFRIVRRAPVPLPVYQRVAVRERLRHQHHRFIAGAVAVRVIFTQHVADGAGGFFELGAGVQAQLGHCIDNAALNRL